MIQLTTIQIEVNVTQRMGIHDWMDRSPRSQFGRPFSNELNDAATRYDRPPREAEPRPAAGIDEARPTPEASKTEVAESPSRQDQKDAARSTPDDSDDVQAQGSDTEQVVGVLDSADTTAPIEDDSTDENQGVDDLLVFDFDPDAVPDEDAVGDENSAGADASAASAVAAILTPLIETAITQAQSGPMPAEASIVSALGLATNAGTNQSQTSAAGETFSTPGFPSSPASPGAPVAPVVSTGTAEADTDSSGQSDTQTQYGSHKPASALPGTATSASLDAAAKPGATLVQDASAIQPASAGQNPVQSLAQTLAAQANLPGAGAGDVSDADSAVNASRLTRGLQSALSQQGGSVTLRLTPPELGTVRIQLQIQGGTVSANFHAEGESARAMLTNQLAHLRTALESQGLTVERLNVQPMQQPGQSSLQQQNQQSTADGRSRGEYTGQQQQSPDDQSRDDDPASRETFEGLMLNEVA